MAETETRPDTFDTVVIFLIGEAVVVVFVVEDTRFPAVIVVELVVLVVFRAMEICLLAVSLTCLSMIGGLPNDRRGFAALFRLEMVVVVGAVVAALGFAVRLGLAVAVADAGLTFVVVVFGTVDLVVAEDFKVVEVLAAAAGLLRGLMSPFAVGFFSIGAGFEAVVAGFGFAVTLALNLVAGFIVLAWLVVFGAGFAAATLLLIAVADAVFFGASKSFGRAVAVVGNFFATPANPRVVEVTDFEGDVGFDFCAVFGAAVFDDGLGALFTFALP